MGSKSISQLVATDPLAGTELIEISTLSSVVTITASTISAAASDNSYNDSGSGFVTAGFEVGNRVRVTGFTGDTANNIYSGVITAITAGKVTIGGTDGDVIVNDAAGESVTITRWEARRATILQVSATALVDGSVGNTILRDSAGLSVVGRAGTTTGDVADIVGTADLVLRVNSAGTTLGFGTVATAGIADDAVTFAKLQNISTLKLVGRTTAASGNAEEITVGPGLTFASGSGTINAPYLLQLAGSDLSTSLVTGTNLAYARAHRAFTLTEVRCSVLTAGTGGITVDINKNGTTVLSTKLTLDTTEKTSLTAATPAVISVSAFADDDEISIDIDAVGTGVKGLIVTLIGT